MVKVIRLNKKINDVTLGTKIGREQINVIIDEDCDCYLPCGDLLFRFRKALLNPIHTDLFHDNIIKFARTPTCNRGTVSSASNLTPKGVFTNPKIMSNIFGFFDRISPTQKYKLKREGKTLPMEARICRFNRDFPVNYYKTLPMIKDINNLYRILIPDKFDTQNALAESTLFKIADTAFTTVTTNVNFTTAIHVDKGDCVQGFGNLSVIDSGSYDGGETCYPEYGIGINVRKNDVLFMDVHTPHGNLPLISCSPNATRLSVVCYLRTKLVDRTAGMNQQDMDDLLAYL
jgi:hypothetical protein